MYGTVARIQIRPGKVEQFLARVRELSAEKDPGLVNEYFYQMDEDPNVIYMAWRWSSSAGRLTGRIRRDPRHVRVRWSFQNLRLVSRNGMMAQW
jgi:hypothetical protein